MSTKLLSENLKETGPFGRPRYRNTVNIKVDINGSEHHCLQLQSLKEEAVCSSETLVSTYTSPWCYSPEDQHQHNVTMCACVCMYVCTYVCMYVCVCVCVCVCMYV
jgi:hypothetical protein